MITKLSAVVAWLLLGAIAFVTLSPIDLRPDTGHVISERVLAFIALGAAFGAGYPRRLPFGVTVTLAAAVGLEAAQFLAPGRHPRLIDASEKLAGGLIGVAIAVMWLTFSSWRQKAASAQRRP
jgi:VanZ family protein